MKSYARPDLAVGRVATRIVVAFVLLLLFAHPCHAAEEKLGLSVQMQGEGFFLNPIVRKLMVDGVTKGSLAEAAGVRTGDQILQIEGRNVSGIRALELRPYLKLDPGQTRTLRLKHTDGTEVTARITKPKT